MRVKHAMIPRSWPRSVILFLIVVLINFGLDPQSPAEARSAPRPKAAPASTLPSGAPLDSSKLTFQLVTAGLTQPVFITYAPDGSNRLFIVQQSGQIRIFKNGALLSTPFLNIAGAVPAFTGTNGEQGLLGLAFDPQYSVNGFFYITYTTHNSDPTFLYTTTLARYQVSASPDVADAVSGSVLLAIPKKYTNHNGGMLAFGPDGFLYMSMGDGGSAGDPDNNAQNLHTLLGKLLRLDVDTTPPAGQKYVIPSSNPFFGSSDSALRQEIWAYGLRNPWRFSFDLATGDLYIGDVGQNIEEEVDFQPAGSPGGQNYGWRILEGNLCYNPSTGCVAPTHYVPPVAAYDHGTNDSFGCAITGGYVYRGSLFPSLAGRYFYGDYCSGRILSLYRDFKSGWLESQLVQTAYNISSFGQDANGELYVADYAAGNIYQIGYQETTTIPPANDTFAGNALIGPLPFQTSLNTVPATQAADDPQIPGCNSGRGLSSVWYRYTPSANINMALDTFGSNYDTVLAVWTGQQGNLSPVACNDDAAPGSIRQSYLQASLSAGTTYYIEATEYNGTYSASAPTPDLGAQGGGALILNAHINWVGSLSVTSDRNVAAIGRPQIGSQIMAYDGFTSGSLTSYVPMLFRNAWGSYDSALYIQNVDLANTANISIRYYDINGILTCSHADAIPKLSSHGYWIPSECVPNGWVGSAAISSDRNIVAIGRPHIGSEIISYNGFASGALSMYIPMLFNQAFGGSYNAALYVQNVDPASAAAITIQYFDTSGSLTCSRSDNIPRLSSHGYWLPSECVPPGWVGSAVVTSDRNVVTVARPHIGSQITAYAGFSGGALTAFVPMMYKNASGGANNTALYIQDLDPANTAAITLKFYDRNGALTCTTTDTIKSFSSHGYWTPTLSCLPDGWTGGVVVSSDHNIAALGRPHFGNEVFAYNGFSATAALSQSLPMLFADAFGGSYNSGYYLQNLDPANTANLTIQYLDVNGKVTYSTTDTLAPLAAKDVWVPGVLAP